MIPSERRPLIEVTEGAREALLAHVRGKAGDGDGRKPLYLRIHVGRG